MIPAPRPGHRHVFVYGSLMHDAVWTHVVAPAPGRAARLSGWRRLAVAGETYPGAVEAAGEAIDGVLRLDVPPADLARLDAFEGADYARRTVRVSLLPGAGAAAGGMAVADPGAVTVAAEVYAWSRADGLAERDWDAEAFAREGLRRFLSTYCGVEPSLPAPGAAAAG